MVALYQKPAGGFVFRVFGAANDTLLLIDRAGLPPPRSATTPIEAG